MTSSEIIQDLENMFGEFDKVAKSDSFLHDPNLGMAIANPKETFDLFFARFTSVVALLDFTDWHKISNLWRILCERLWFKIVDGITYISLSQYLSRFRQCDFDLCQIDGFSTQNRSDKNKRFRLKPNTTESLTENLISRHHKKFSLYHSGYLKKCLIQKGRCFKCGKRGHRTTNLDAQCQVQSAISDEQLSLKLENAKKKTSSWSGSEN